MLNQVESRVTGVAEAQDLFTFAFFPKRPTDPPGTTGWNSRLNDLGRLAKQEAWSTPSSVGLDVLANYLKFTFKRLAEEDKVLTAINPSGSKLAAFNTGLRSRSAGEAIHALFDTNPVSDRQRWILRDFVTDSDSALLYFKTQPVRAVYCDSPAELCFDSKVKIAVSLDHILNDHLDRYPEIFRGSPHLRQIALRGAIEEAIQLAETNFRAVVPQFRFGRLGMGRSRPQLLLPLCLTDSAHPDLAMVIEREEFFYRARTVLPIDKAYMNARLIAPPPAEWLLAAA